MSSVLRRRRVRYARRSCGRGCAPIRRRISVQLYTRIAAVHGAQGAQKRQKKGALALQKGQKAACKSVKKGV